MFARMAIANLGRSRLRVAFLSIVIAVGASIFLLTQALADRVELVTQQQVLQHASFLRLDVVVPPTGVAPDLTDGALSAIGSSRGVATVDPVLRELVGLDGSPIGIMASTLLPGDDPPIVEGRPTPITLADDEVVLPSSLDGTPLGVGLGSTVTIQYTVRTGPASGELRNQVLHVVALYDAAWQPDGPNVAFVAPATLRAWLEFRDALKPGQLGREVGYEAAVVIARDAASVPTVAAALRGQGYTVTDLQERLSQVPGVIKLVQIAGWIVFAAVALMTLVAASATVGTYVRQRRPEIGLLKAIGYRNLDVLAMLLAETAIIGLVASVIAVAASMALGFVVTLVLSQQPELVTALGAGPLLPSPIACLEQAAILVAASLVGATIPALQAARMEPALALREP